MASQFRKKLKNDSVYLLTRFLILIFNLLPRRTAIACGAFLGQVSWRLLKRDQENVHHNLRIAYGDQLSVAERQDIGRQFFIHTGKNLVDVARLPRHFENELKPLISVEGIEHWQAAIARGKGVFGVTAHLGNFELLAAFIRSLGYQVAVIGREMYDRRLNALLIHNRQSVGLTNIATTASPKRIIAWLRRGHVIGVLIDIDSFRVRSMFVPVFGQLANTPIGQSVIALKTGAALVPAACLRTADNRYKVIIKPEVNFERTGDSEKDTYIATLLCNKALEEIIDSYRDQWAWIHNRWSTRPENAA